MIYIYNKYLINKREREREREREKISQIQPNSAKFYILKFHRDNRLIPIPEIALIALLSITTSIGINLLFMPSIVARTEKRTYHKLQSANAQLKSTTSKLTKSAKLDLIETIFQSPIGATLNVIKPDLYEKLKENPDRLEGYLDLYESLSARPEIKKLISNFMKQKEPQKPTYSDIEGLR